MRVNLRTFICASAIGISPTPSEALDLHQHPKSDRISYGGVVVQVRPVQHVRLKAPFAGKLYLKEDGGHLDQGTVWAELEPEQIAREREAMDLTLMLEERKSKPLAMLELADTRASLENRRDELKRSLAMTEEVLAEPDLAQLYLGNNDRDAAQSRATLEQMNHRIASQLEAIEEALRFVGTPAQVDAELRLAELQLARKDLELKRKEDESRLKMPFTGELRLIASPPEDPGAPLVLQPGEEIAEISDYTTLRCDMIVSRSEFRQLPTPSLSLEFRSDGESSLMAKFHSQKNMVISGQEELVYVFEFPPELSFQARSFLGGRVTADLVVTLPAQAHLVPKLELVRQFPDQIREQGWQIGVESAFPGCRVLAIGQSMIAIFPSPKHDE